MKITAPSRSFPSVFIVIVLSFALADPVFACPTDPQRPLSSAYCINTEIVKLFDQCTGVDPDVGACSNALGKRMGELAEVEHGIEYLRALPDAKNRRGLRRDTQRLRASAWMQSWAIISRLLDAIENRRLQLEKVKPSVRERLEENDSTQTDLLKRIPVLLKIYEQIGWEANNRGNPLQQIAPPSYLAIFAQRLEKVKRAFAWRYEI
jgi:hypothetical protein